MLVFEFIYLEIFCVKVKIVLYEVNLYQKYKVFNFIVIVLDINFCLELESGFFFRIKGKFFVWFNIIYFVKKKREREGQRRVGNNFI